jgi:hypothetical protein
MGSGFTPGEEASGVIPQVMEELFSRVSSTQGIDFTVRVSFVEIHKVCHSVHESKSSTEGAVSVVWTHMQWQSYSLR